MKKELLSTNLMRKQFGFSNFIIFGCFLILRLSSFTELLFFVNCFVFVFALSVFIKGSDERERKTGRLMEMKLTLKEKGEGG